MKAHSAYIRHRLDEIRRSGPRYSERVLRTVAAEARVSDLLVKVGRLALRQEGDLWVAYYALPDTMDGALGTGG